MVRIIKSWWGNALQKRFRVGQNNRLDRLVISVDRHVLDLSHGAWLHLSVLGFKF